MNPRVNAVKRLREAVGVDVSALSWSDLKRVAKEAGVKVSRRSRSDIERELLSDS